MAYVIPGHRTVKHLLAAALLPVGQTLYVYGGGWNITDTSGGPQATSIGISPSWRQFFLKQTADYSYHDHAAEHGENPWYYAGLDCSGYLGWVIYQVFHKGCGKPNFVVSSTAMAKTLAEQHHLGTWTQDISGPSSFLPGDLFSMEGHVWLCVGRCTDNSLVILHSTPSPSHTGAPGGGVQLSGVGDMPDCQAVALAQRYMQIISPEWTRRYQAVFRFFSDYTTISGEMGGKFSWFHGPRGLCDPEGYRTSLAPDILCDLLS